MINVCPSILIAVSHGFDGDPYTCSTIGNGVDIENAEDCLGYLATTMKIPANTIDEILVIEDMNGVSKHYVNGSHFNIEE